MVTVRSSWRRVATHRPSGVVSVKKAAGLPSIVICVSERVALSAAARRRRAAASNQRVIFGTSLKHNDVSTAIYRDFLPAALAEKRYAAAPAPRVVGEGLEHLQHALDTLRRGVSATKIVVTLS